MPTKKASSSRWPLSGASRQEPLLAIHDLEEGHFLRSASAKKRSGRQSGLSQTDHDPNAKSGSLVSRSVGQHLRACGGCGLVEHV